MTVRLLTDQHLRVLLMTAAKAYQELTEHHGHKHAAAIKIAADVMLDIASRPLREVCEALGDRLVSGELPE